MIAARSYKSLKEYLTAAITDAIHHLEVMVVAYESEEAKPNQPAPYTVLIMTDAHDRLCSVDFKLSRDRFSFEIFDAAGNHVKAIEDQFIGAKASMRTLRQAVADQVDVGRAALNSVDEAKSGGGELGEPSVADSPIPESLQRAMGEIKSLVPDRPSRRNPSSPAA